MYPRKGPRNDAVPRRRAPARLRVAPPSVLTSVIAGGYVTASSGGGVMAVSANTRLGTHSRWRVQSPVPPVLLSWAPPLALAAGAVSWLRGVACVADPPFLVKMHTRGILPCGREELNSPASDTNRNVIAVNWSLMHDRATLSRSCGGSSGSVMCSTCSVSLSEGPGSAKTSGQNRPLRCSQNGSISFATSVTFGCSWDMTPAWSVTLQCASHAAVCAELPESVSRAAATFADSTSARTRARP